MNRRAKWFRLWAVAGLLHLTLASLGCFFGENFPAILGIYGYYTGSVSKLSFFAPGVGSQLRVRYSGLKANGQITEGPLLTGRGETDLRIEKITAAFWRNNPSDEFRRSLAASWAGKILAKNPAFAAVSISLDAYDLPTVASYQAGRRPKWIPYYYATFRKPLGLP